MKLVVDTPFGEILNLDIDEIVVPGQAGELGFLPGHTPLVTLLDVGELRWRVKDAWEYAAVNLGYAEVSADTIRILTETCEPATKIDVERARVAQAGAQAQLDKLNTVLDPGAQRVTWERALKRAKVRQQVASHLSDVKH
jgi:F-type H+-transporting ATPase subunit epsilon